MGLVVLVCVESLIPCVLWASLLLKRTYGIHVKTCQNLLIDHDMLRDIVELLNSLL